MGRKPIRTSPSMFSPFFGQVGHPRIVEEGKKESAMVVAYQNAFREDLRLWVDGEGGDELPIARTGARRAVTKYLGYLESAGCFRVSWLDLEDICWHMLAYVGICWHVVGCGWRASRLVLICYILLGWYLATAYKTHEMGWIHQLYPPVSPPFPSMILPIFSHIASLAFSSQSCFSRWNKHMWAYRCTAMSMEAVSQLMGVIWTVNAGRIEG